MKLADSRLRPDCGAILLTLFAVMPLAFAQNAGPIPSSTTRVKPLAFEVVSIRPAKPGSNFVAGFGTTPDGYRVPSQSLWFTLMIAYFPQGRAYWSKDRLSRAPSWIDEPYAIDARVSEADLNAWQRQGTTLDKKPMLRQMLQTMLADRCHLIAHLVPGPPISGLSLEVGSHGPHLADRKPGETLPDGIPLNGGVYVPWKPGEKPKLSFYGVTMAEVAYFLSMSNGLPVQDHTGLTGRYDFIVSWIDDPDSKLPAGAIDSNDPDPLSHWDFESLGLRSAPTKVPAQTLIIDHIEKPSQN